MKPKLHTVTLADMRARPAMVTRLALRNGGVVVTDAAGEPRFRLVIPNKPLGTRPRRTRR